MRDPSVSVLMGVLNGMPYIDEAIESILRQTLPELELIVIDDGSSDGTSQAIGRWAARDDRIVAIRNESNMGTSRALNLGLRAARGQFITRQDADDSSLPERLAEQVRFLQANPEVGAVGSSVVMVDAEGQPRGRRRGPLHDAEIQEALLDQMCFCGPTVMARRRSFEAAGLYFDEELSYSEDYDLCLRLAEVAALAILEQPLYRYRQHGNSVSCSRRQVQMRRKAIALERAISRRFGSDPPPRCLVYVSRDYLRAAVLAFAGQDLGQAQECLAHARQLNPSLLENESLVAEAVTRYAPRSSVDAALSFTAGIFELLFPHGRRLSRLKRRLLSRLHMNEVFEGARREDPPRVDQHLWQGIRNDPSWLLKRGVLAMLFRKQLSAVSRQLSANPGRARTVRVRRSVSVSASKRPRQGSRDGRGF